jgi:uncharacterized protein (DUF58 family)
MLWAWVGVVALIALNRGVDLLWGMAILLVTSMAAAWVLPILQLRKVRIARRQFPSSGVVGEALHISYEIEVPGWRPRYGIEIHDRLANRADASSAAYLPRVAGRKEVAFSWTPQTRGCWSLEDITLESRYPLGLTTARRTVPASPHEITVYPDFVPLRSLPIQGEAHPKMARTVSRRRAGHDEFFGLKQYQPGDEARAIHWRASARLGELVLREYEHQQDRQMWIVLELAEDEHLGTGRLGSSECMFRIAHSIAVKAIEEDVPVGLLYRAGGQIRRSVAAADKTAYLQLRETLARVDVEDQPPLPGWLPQSMDQLPIGGTWVLFNLGSAGAHGTLERVAVQRGAFPLLVEFDHHSFSRGDDDPRGRIVTHATAQSLVSTVPCGADLRDLFGRP